MPAPEGGFPSNDREESTTRWEAARGGVSPALAGSLVKEGDLSNSQRTVSTAAKMRSGVALLQDSCIRDFLEQQQYFYQRSMQLNDTTLQPDTQPESLSEESVGVGVKRKKSNTFTAALSTSISSRLETGSAETEREVSASDMLKTKTEAAYNGEKHEDMDTSSKQSLLPPIDGSTGDEEEGVLSAASIRTQLRLQLMAARYVQQGIVPPESLLRSIAQQLPSQQQQHQQVLQQQRETDEKRAILFHQIRKKLLQGSREEALAEVEERQKFLDAILSEKDRDAFDAFCSVPESVRARARLERRLLSLYQLQESLRSAVLEEGRSTTLYPAAAAAGCLLLRPHLPRSLHERVLPCLCCCGNFCCRRRPGAAAAAAQHHGGGAAHPYSFYPGGGGGGGLLVHRHNSSRSSSFYYSRANGASSFYPFSPSSSSSRLSCCGCCCGGTCGGGGNGSGTAAAGGASRESHSSSSSSTGAAVASTAAVPPGESSEFVLFARGEGDMMTNIVNPATETAQLLQRKRKRRCSTAGGAQNTVAAVAAAREGNSDEIDFILYEAYLNGDAAAAALQQQRSWFTGTTAAEDAVAEDLQQLAKIVSIS